MSIGFSTLALSHLTNDLTEITKCPLYCAELGTATLVVIGLWTPVAATSEAALQITFMSLDPGHGANSLCGAAVAAALAMLGPGAWSLDARLFGRKRIM